MSWLAGLLGRADPPPSPDDAADRARKRPGGVPQHLTTAGFDRFLREHPRAIVDVWAPWCGPCRAFAPMFAAAAREWGDRVAFGKVHADHEPALVALYEVRSIPSLLFFRNGELVRTEVGAVPPERFVRLMNRVFRDIA
jgi:thioredoxin